MQEKERQQTVEKQEKRQFPKPNYECEMEKNGRWRRGEVDSVNEGFIFGSRDSYALKNKCISALKKEW